MNWNFQKYADQLEQVLQVLQVLQLLIVYVYSIKPNLMGYKFRESQGFAPLQLVVGFTE